jgi:hypothetical protein
MFCLLRQIDRGGATSDQWDMKMLAEMSPLDSPSSIGPVLRRDRKFHSGVPGLWLHQFT